MNIPERAMVASLTSCRTRLALQWRASIERLLLQDAAQREGVELRGEGRGS